MCQKIEIINRVRGGELALCKHCNMYHLVYNNLFFVLTKKELKKLRNYINNIDVEYWQEKNRCINVARKIPLPSTQNNLVIMFTPREIKEFKVLLSNRKYSISDTIEVNNIDYDIILN